MDFIVLGLAAWRLARMLAKERGPFDVFARLRLVAGGSEVGVALGCMSCLTVWTAGALPRLPRWVPRLLAAAAVAKLLDDYFYSPPGADDELAQRPFPDPREHRPSLTREQAESYWGL